MTALPHTIAARFEVGKVLGEGGYGVVHEAVSKQDGTLVAIKVMSRGKMDAEAEKNVRNEVAILQSLEHPNIVRGYDFFEDKENFHFVMEKIDGGELFDRIVAKKHYSEKEARDLARALLDGIKCCHDHNIAHRDLKPENLLMTSPSDDANVKIVDFGFAARCKGMSLSNQCGTPNYVAPEILENKLHGTPVDMWSFGVILYILLGGYPPFYHQDQKKLYKKIRRGVFEFHEKYWSGVSSEAKDLICALLTVNPLKRLTAKQALAHPWMHVDDEKMLNSHLGGTLEEMKRFRAQERFRKGVNAVKAVNMMKKLMGGITGMKQAMADEELPHTIHDRYVLGDILGEGGYAVVKSGTSIADNTTVAVKIMNRKSMDKETETAMRNEISLLQSLNHPNIVRGYDFFEEPGHFYFVMEKISGGELFDRIVEKKHYGEGEARQLVKVLLSAIKYCHHHHIVHRDLKPENLLMTSSEDDADLKLVDFGFAAITHGEDLTQQCGTPGYIAPEILECKPHGVQVDMWSFGVILYILLGGYPPFYDQDQKKLFKKIKTATYQFHEKYWSGVSEEAKDLIRSLLVVDPHVRLNVDQALAHPWLHSEDSGGDLTEKLGELKKFQASKRFKKVANAVKVINKMKKLMGNMSFVEGNKELPHTIEARYELGEVLGEGGYAVVKAAVSKVDKLEVAVKIMDRKNLDQDTENSIRQEVAILQSLDHPNIVGATDFFEEPEYFYVVLERVNGGELFDRIVAKTFYNEKEARDLAAVLLKALKYLHDKHIVHRDLKPENLLMTSPDDDADVKLVDFGFAAYVDGFSLSDQCGTPGYLAPEIIENKLHGTPVDMWSFGVILYILLGGYPPFHHDDQKELFRLIRKGTYEFHEEYWSQVSDEAKNLINGLLTVNPLKRLTVDQALAHPWLQTDEEKLASKTLTNTLEELRKFQARRKFRKGVNAVKAVVRMRKIMGGLSNLKAAQAAKDEEDANNVANLKDDGYVAKAEETT